MSAAEAPVPVISVRPVRAIVREFLLPIVEGEDELDQTVLTNLAYMRFADDDEFHRAVSRDVIPILISEVLGAIIHEKKSTHIRTPSGAVTRESLLKSEERLREIFESTGSGYRSILRLTKRELLDLVDRDEKVIGSLTRWNNFRLELAAKMDDDQIVADLPENLRDEIWEKHIG